MSASAAKPANPAKQPAIEARGIHLAFDGHEVLHGIDLTICYGEAVALLGANGSGKSTLMRALVGIHPIRSGAISLLGTPLKQRSRVDWEHIGYVPQRSGPAAGLPATATEVVMTGLVNRRTLRLPRHAKRRSLEALEQVGLADRAGHATGTLSGGQQQRVAIARALVRQPKLLLLDEPMTGVDLPTQEAIAALLRELHASGTTVMVVLHELAGLSAMLQRSIVLDQGVVVRDGAELTNLAGAGAGGEHQHEDHGEEEPVGAFPRSLP